MKLYKIEMSDDQEVRSYPSPRAAFSSPNFAASPLTCASFPSKEKMDGRRCQNKKDIEDDLIVQKVGADYRELWA